MGVTILLTTYNGEKYLAEQLESLFAQTYQNFKVIVSDDGSQDDTWKILTQYASTHPDKIIISQRKENSGGAKYNFLDLMIRNKDDYVMLCDQDDVWFPEKIEKSLHAIQGLEKEYGNEKALLVHTDLVVVDEKLNTINSSFKKAMNADYSKTSLNQQLIQNTLTGCTAIYNRALSDLIYEMPAYCVMHDWWLMLIASAFGHIQAIDDKTIWYRQHGENEIGASDVRTFSYKMKRLLDHQGIQQAINQTYCQAQSFLDIYRNQMTFQQIQLLESYIIIPQLPKWKRWRTIIQYRTLKNGKVRNIGYFLFI